MSIAYLNDGFYPLDACAISPMDRGFLFGDGIYEVIPCYDGELIAFAYHYERLRTGLDALSIPCPLSSGELRDLLTELITQNGAGHLSLYLQITRGSHAVRKHVPIGPSTPTIFATASPRSAFNDGDATTVQPQRVVTARDLRWARKHIKSIALLGSVMHLQEAYAAGASEALLFNEQDQLTEAATSNVFIVHNGIIKTPALDHEKLAGVTRRMLVELLAGDGRYPLEETVVTRTEVLTASEVWLTSSTKEVVPVVAIDGEPVNDGNVGPLWSYAQALFALHRLQFP